ncbi:hypothetical protein PPL_00528 [Heterostelium album PN500]|uniref:Uncharacterized protein n=1 Tax=Heterostelium pallidum (strain ATCC 26659 / Pp 5 / PN500) TaxID=670386 RepID=D3AWQ0_HETP5|nr:hypothetical protein PPL_00528 [Heterostelium album PN500]EFA86723.1 hypothetical protein PPL_00528 [Heterostelium album PN500]|eukprot:XP_020438827.1 hypothetical protein PPL_00528 [Heterostelium album PN500]
MFRVVLNHVDDQRLYVNVRYTSDDSLRVVLATTVTEHLREVKDGQTLQEQLGNDTAQREDVHFVGEFAVCRWTAVRLVETLRCQVAGTSTANIKVEREVRWIVFRDERWFVTSEIREVYPVGGCDHDILALDITVTDSLEERLIQRLQQLKSNELLLYQREEWTCTSQSVI